jgi:hypothetical protein
MKYIDEVNNMKKIKFLVIALVVTAILGSTGVAFAAASGKTPAEILASLTGKTVEQIYAERGTDKTFGALAQQYGKLDQFKAQVLEEKKAILDQRVKDGKLTQQQADAVYKAMKDNQATCDGTGSARIGQKSGVGFGMGQGNGMGQGRGTGNGRCQGNGCGGMCGNR